MSTSTQITQYRNIFSYTVHAVYRTSENPQKAPEEYATNQLKKIKEEELNLLAEETGLESLLDVRA